MAELRREKYVTSEDSNSALERSETEEDPHVAAIAEQEAMETAHPEPTPLFDVRRLLTYGFCVFVVRTGISLVWPHFDSFGPRSRTVQVAGFKIFTEPTKWKKSCSQHVAATLLQWQGETVDKWRYDEIGCAINPKQDGVKTSDLIRFLSESFNCRPCENATIETLRKHLDTELPAVAVVSAVGSKTTHSVIVTGYKTDKSNQVTHWLIHDNGIYRGWRSDDVFQAIWKGLEERPCNYCILISTKQQTASSTASTAQGDAG